jgi:hypothetical protein
MSAELTKSKIDPDVAAMLQGAWVWERSEDLFTCARLTRSDHSDASATILHITMDGGFVANARGDETGRWWVMKPATFGLWAEPVRLLSLARTFEDAAAANYYYNDFVTRLDNRPKWKPKADINGLGEITAKR